MSDLFFYEMSHRAVLCVRGADATDFLQGLLSNDMAKASDKHALYALLLTPQGRFLFDFFIIKQTSADGKQAYLLDCQRTHKDDVIKKFSTYRLRADVLFETMDEMKVWSIWGMPKPDLDNMFLDPRHRELGWRLFSKQAPQNLSPASADDYLRHRIKLAVPEAGAELTQDRFPLECNLDVLNAIDFHKGCYIGQEVTSRMKRRADGGRKRIALVEGKNALTRKEPLMVNGQKIGLMLSVLDHQGLALVRHDRIQSDHAELDRQKVRLRFLL